MVADVRRLGQRAGEAGQVLVAELAQGLADGQADQGQAAVGDVTCPVAAPPEPDGYLRDLLHVAWMPVAPLPAKITRILGEQQVQVWQQVAFGEAPGDERHAPVRLRSARRAGVGRLIHAASCGCMPSSRAAALRRIRRASGLTGIAANASA